MSVKLKLKKGDKVIVIAGKNKGKRGEILRVLPKLGRIVVSGVNEVIKHTKPSRTSEGGRITKNAPLAISNVAFFDEKANKPSRVGFRFAENGKKERFSKVSGEVIG